MALYPEIGAMAKGTRLKPGSMASQQGRCAGGLQEGDLDRGRSSELVLVD